MPDRNRNLLALFTATDQMDTRQRFEALQTAPLSLQMFDSVPAWAFVQAACNNGNAPLIEEGEVVVVEPGAFLPAHSGLFVIEYVSKPAASSEPETRTRRIVQTRETPIGWWAGPIQQGDNGSSIFVSDGPYPNPAKLAEKLVGRVVGILRTASFIDRMAKGGR